MTLGIQQKTEKLVSAAKARAAPRTFYPISNRLLECDACGKGCLFIYTTICYLTHAYSRLPLALLLLFWRSPSRDPFLSDVWL